MRYPIPRSLQWVRTSSTSSAIGLLPPVLVRAQYQTATDLAEVAADRQTKTSYDYTSGGGEMRGAGNGECTDDVAETETSTVRTLEVSAATVEALSDTSVEAGSVSRMPCVCCDVLAVLCRWPDFVNADHLEELARVSDKPLPRPASVGRSVCSRSWPLDGGQGPVRGPGESLMAQADVEAATRTLLEG